MSKKDIQSNKSELTVADLLEKLESLRAQVWLEQTVDFHAIGGGSKVMALGEDLEEIDKNIISLKSACKAVGIQL